MAAASVQNLQGHLSCRTGIRTVEQLPGLGSWASDPCVLGIDEAGRGPVLGPMVYAAAYAPASVDLKSQSFADSKALTADAREGLFARICSSSPAPITSSKQQQPQEGTQALAPAGPFPSEAAAGDGHGQDTRPSGKDHVQVGWCSELLSAAHISAGMLGATKTSLNALATDSTMRIIRRLLDQGVNVTQVYVDTVGDAERYQTRLSREFPSLSFTVCPKADALYPIVSAASIVAKVVRDAALQQAAQDSGVPASVPLGTGYPADPATKAWLKASMDRVWGFRQAALVRFSWEPVVRLMAEGGCVPLAFEADDESAAGTGSGGQQQRLNLGAKRMADVVETSGVGRHAYFRARRLQRVAEIF